MSATGLRLEPKKLPPGTRLEVVMWFDNSSANPDPSKTISYGEPTADEMMIGYLNFTNTEPDDLIRELIFPVGLWDELEGTTSLVDGQETTSGQKLGLSCGVRQR